MDNDRVIGLLSGHYGRRLERWFSRRGADARGLCKEYSDRYRCSMDHADFGADNGRFTSYANCLSGVVAVEMCEERGCSREEAIACYDYLSGPLRRFAAWLWGVVDLLPNGFEMLRDSVRGDLMGAKGVCWTTEVVEDSDERFEYRCHTCLYYDICCDRGCPWAIQLFCNHDHHAWDALHRHVRFERYGGVGEPREDGSISDGLSSTEQGCLCHDAFIRVRKARTSM